MSGLRQFLKLPGGRAMVFNRRGLPQFRLNLRVAESDIFAKKFAYFAQQLTFLRQSPSSSDVVHYFQVLPGNNSLLYVVTKDPLKIY